MEKKTIAKKTVILFVLKMLEEGSSPEHPITYSAMAKTLEALGLPGDRKTVGRNVAYIDEFGRQYGSFRVVKTGKGVYLEKNA